MSDADRHTELVTKISSSQTRLLAYIYSLTANRQTAEEVLQATNLVIWKKADSYQPGTNFIAWAFKIARLQVLENRGKVCRDELVFSQELMDELSKEASKTGAFEDLSDRQQALSVCLQKLTPSRQELLWMRYRDSMSLSQVADRIGKSTNATGVLLHRLRQLLHDCIQRQLTTSGGMA